jgi:PD-(D/E)XK nuclease superfamily
MPSTRMPLPATLDKRFSQATPGLQLLVNSSSLGPFKLCPRRYYYEIIWGWRSFRESVHLVFGGWIHEGRARYEQERFRGTSHDDAMDLVLDWALRVTWNKELKRPWQSDDPGKNRLGLVRTLVWYLDTFGRDDPFETLLLGDGSPAVELGFQFASGYETKAGEVWEFFGTLDRLAKLNDLPYILDTKTTGHEVGPRFFSGFSPDNQFSLYMLGARIAFDVPVKALIVDGIQIGATFSRMQRGPVARDDAQLDEWLRDSGTWLGQMETCASEGYWPQNDKSCGAFGGCPFREVCSASPIGRQIWLEKSFTRRQTMGAREL